MATIGSTPNGCYQFRYRRLHGNQKQDSGVHKCLPSSTRVVPAVRKVPGHLSLEIWCRSPGYNAEMICPLPGMALKHSLDFGEAWDYTFSDKYRAINSIHGNPIHPCQKLRRTNWSDTL